MSSQAQHQAAYLDGIAVPLRISSAPTPAPGPDQVLIKAKAVAINPVDWKIQERGLTVSAWPFILGRDVAGEVVAVGQDVKSLQPGSRVLAQSLSLTTKRIEEGTFQEYVLASVKSTARIPDEMSYEQASVLPLAVSTSASALFSPLGLDLPLPSHSVRPSGKVVLIWGGSSSVGCAGIQLAVAAGFDVYTTCSKKNFSLVEALGAKKAFDYSSLSVVGDIVAETQKAAKVAKVVGAYDAIGEYESQMQIAQILAQLAGGKIATVLNPAEELPATVVSTRISAASIFLPPQEDIGKSIFQDFLPKALVNGQVKAKPDPEVVGQGLQALQGALDKLKAGVSAKKIVVSL